MAEPDFLAMLRALRASDVECIVVGVLAACLQGAPVVALELAIVPRRSAENLAKLLIVLRRLDASPEGDVTATVAADLSMDAESRWSTRSGTLDVSPSIEGRGYDDLRPLAVDLEVAEDLRIAVLGLESLVAFASESGEVNGRPLRPVLAQTLEESRRASA